MSEPGKKERVPSSGLNYTGNVTYSIGTREPYSPAYNLQKCTGNAYNEIIPGTYPLAVFYTYRGIISNSTMSYLRDKIHKNSGK